MYMTLEVSCRADHSSHGTDLQNAHGSMNKNVQQAHVTDDAVTHRCSTPMWSRTSASTQCLPRTHPLLNSLLLSLQRPSSRVLRDLLEKMKKRQKSQQKGIWLWQRLQLSQAQQPISQLPPLEQGEQVCMMSLQAHSLSLVGTTITNIAHNSALLAFSNTCIHCAPKLPSVTLWGQRAMRFNRLIASGAHTLHGMPKLSTIILFLIPTSQPHVQCSWLQHSMCHDTHMAGGVIQAVQMLTRDLHMQTRSLAEWELTGTRIAVQTCKHISVALIGLLIPFAVTVAAQGSSCAGVGQH